MQVTIEIKVTDVSQKTVRSKDGKEYVIREQDGWVDLGEAYPQKIRISLEQGKQAYAIGRYQVSEKSLYVDRFGQLKLGRLRLDQAA
ncbi:MAG: single-stranded DNA-binding protein [Steroidobacteraceae bacterium]